MPVVNRAMTVALLCFSVHGCSSEIHPARSTAFEVTITHLADTAGHVWWMGSADFNQDGSEDILIAGHRSTQGARLFFGDSTLNAWAPGEKQQDVRQVLGAERDRHGCAVADITGDARPDVFCVSGAEKGDGGNDNELWKNLDGYRFERITNHGAEDTYARGRRASFFNFDGQYPPELVTTVWGDRADNLPNRSRVWRWTGTRFHEINTTLGDKQGGRCIAVYDINADGLDDLLTCAEKHGFSVYMNNGKLDFEERPLGGTDLRNTWWWDVALTPGKTGEPTLIAFIVEPIGRQNIHIGTLSDKLRLSAKQYIPCSFDNGKADSEIYCASVVWHDFNADGTIDLYVVRRSDREMVSAQGDVDDLIIFGPSYTSYLPVRRSGTGAGTDAISIGDAVVRLTAGDAWPGALELVRVVERSDP